jgi:hypothetical protein
MEDGHLGKCKECAKLDIRNYRLDPVKRERIREYDRIRFHSPHTRKEVMDYQNKWRRTIGKIQNLARQKLNRAIKSGLIIKKSCEICGDVNAQAHHNDYLKPLNVVWLCFKHHREAHGQIVGKL